jgi:XTP/dITP diphosphohydrolase
MLEIFVATQNIGKQKEIREILKIISKDIKREIIPIFPSEKEKLILRTHTQKLYGGLKIKK